ncbi:MAG: Zn-finger nucleic acid-binding protein [Myxococcota bacterium]
MIGCPVCGDAMRSETIHDVEVDVCDQHGVWLDQKELLLVSEAERHSRGRFVLQDLFRQERQPPFDVDRRLPCPSCKNPMVLEQYAGVRLDWCAQHGVWLDTDELSAVLDNLRLGHRYRRGMTLRLWAGRY